MSFQPVQRLLFFCCAPFERISCVLFPFNENEQWNYSFRRHEILSMRHTDHFYGALMVLSVIFEALQLQVPIDFHCMEKSSVNIVL